MDDFSAQLDRYTPAQLVAQLGLRGVLVPPEAARERLVQLLRAERKAVGEGAPLVYRISRYPPLFSPSCPSLPVAMFVSHHSLHTIFPAGQGLCHQSMDLATHVWKSYAVKGEPLPLDADGVWQRAPLTLPHPDNHRLRYMVMRRATGCVDSIYQIDLGSDTWAALAENGDPPLGQDAWHDACLYQGNLLTVQVNGSGSRCRVRRFEFATCLWTVLSDAAVTPAIPIQGLRGNALCVGNALLCFSGPERVACLNLVHYTWICSPATLAHQPLDAVATLQYHAGTRSMYGYSGSRLVALDLNTLTWSTPATLGRALVPAGSLLHSSPFATTTTLFSLSGGHLLFLDVVGPTPRPPSPHPDPDPELARLYAEDHTKDLVIEYAEGDIRRIAAHRKVLSRRTPLLAALLRKEGTRQFSCHSSVMRILVDYCYDQWDLGRWMAEQPDFPLVSLLHAAYQLRMHDFLVRTMDQWLALVEGGACDKRQAIQMAGALGYVPEADRYRFLGRIAFILLVNLEELYGNPEFTEMTRQCPGVLHELQAVTRSKPSQLRNPCPRGIQLMDSLWFTADPK